MHFVGKMVPCSGRDNREHVCAETTTNRFALFGGTGTGTDRQTEGHYSHVQIAMLPGREKSFSDRLAAGMQIQGHSIMQQSLLEFVGGGSGGESKWDGCEGQ